MPLFCRHNRLTPNCPICSRELEAELKAKAPSRARAGAQGTRRGGRAPARRPGVVTRRVPRPADDGYRNPLVPGLRATADAERLAAALVAAHARLAPPGPYPVVAAEPDREEATWLAFLLAPSRDPTLPSCRRCWPRPGRRGRAASCPDLPGTGARTVAAYRAWARRAGSQAEAFLGEPGWSPERRFGRVFERLALPGLRRAARYELLVALGSAELYPLEADALHLGAEDDATSLAAKRLLVSGDRMLLERRARDLAAACELPMAALDRGLAVWGDSEAVVDLDLETPSAVRRALGLR